jgi:CBS domain-containing protein
MKVSDCMTRDPRIVSPDQTIQEAARIMAEMDAGVLPVGENDRLVGMITDRDIAVRAVCAGKGPQTKISDAMTREVKYCFEDEDIEHVARNMGNLQVRRLPVMNREKRLVGIVTLGDIATNRRADSESVAETLGSISRAGGSHSQSAH